MECDSQKRTGSLVEWLRRFLRGTPERGEGGCKGPWQKRAFTEPIVLGYKDGYHQAISDAIDIVSLGGCVQDRIASLERLRADFGVSWRATAVPSPWPDKPLR